MIVYAFCHTVVTLVTYKIINEKGQLVGSIAASVDKKGLGIIKFIYAKGKLYCGNNELSFI